MTDIEKLNEIKKELKFGAEIEGEDYAHQALSKEDIEWLIITIEEQQKEIEKWKDIADYLGDQ